MFFNLRQTWTKTAIVLSLGYLVSCTQSNSTPQTSSNNATDSSSDRAKVVVTTSVLCDMTKQIAGDTIDLTCLLPPGTDAHVYEPVPEDRRAIETAQLILYSGYNLEPDLIKIVKSTSNSAPKIAVGEVAVPKPLMGEEHHHENDGEEHQEAEKVPDPHIWQNAQNGSRMVGVIQTNLAQIVPANAELYTKNAKALKEELAQIDRWIKTQIATIPQTQRKIVTTHDALGYYAAAYEIPVEGAIEGLTTEEKPTATQVKALIDTVKQTKVPTIFAETVVNPKLIETVAKDAKVKVSQRELFSDSLGAPGSEGDTYPKMLIANTQTIVEGLGGKFTPFESK